jgi:hypothetical protein
MFHGLNWLGMFGLLFARVEKELANNVSTAENSAASVQFKRSIIVSPVSITLTLGL